MLADIAPDGAREADGLGVTCLKLLKNPLEFILADHHRQRSLCHLLDKLADAPTLALAPAALIVRYIGQDLSIHVIDEEEDLFPLIRRRAAPEDDIERVLGLLSCVHTEDAHRADVIVEGLRSCCAAGDPELTSELRAALRSFARRQRRHLAVENAIVIPLAEVRLSSKDREGLARRMAARRCIQLSEERSLG